MKLEEYIEAKSTDGEEYTVTELDSELVVHRLGYIINEVIKENGEYLFFDGNYNEMSRDEVESADPEVFTEDDYIEEDDGSIILKGK